jgi:hypothetical protein
MFSIYLAPAAVFPAGWFYVDSFFCADKSGAASAVFFRAEKVFVWR